MHKPHDAGVYDTPMTEDLAEQFDGLKCPTPEGCHMHGCHGECLPAAPSMTAEELRCEVALHFTKEVGGPNPLYRCNRCKESVFGEESCLREHALSHRAVVEEKCDGD